MVRYLSPTWFDRLRSHTEGAAASTGGVTVAVEPPGALVLRHRISAAVPTPATCSPATDSPGTDSPGTGSPATGSPADYDVVIDAGQAVIRHPVRGHADLTFTSDYATAAAIAAGRLSTRAALAEGRLRVAGDVGILSRRASDVGGLDPVPAALRAETEF